MGNGHQPVSVPSLSRARSQHCPGGGAPRALSSSIGWGVPSLSSAVVVLTLAGGRVRAADCQDGHGSFQRRLTHSGNTRVVLDIDSSGFHLDDAPWPQIPVLLQEHMGVRRVHAAREVAREQGASPAMCGAVGKRHATPED